MASKYFWRGVLITALGVISRAYFAFLLMMSLFGRVLVARRQEDLPARSFRDNVCFPATDTVLPMDNPVFREQGQPDGIVGDRITSGLATNLKVKPACHLDNSALTCRWKEHTLLKTCRGS